VDEFDPKAIECLKKIIEQAESGEIGITHVSIEEGISVLGRDRGYIERKPNGRSTVIINYRKIQ
jgi:hypothetical protein